MTQVQRSELDKAIERATAYGIIVTGKGQRKSDHAPVYFTTSRGSVNKWHIVAVVGGRLFCECAASRYGHICCHRAAVHLKLLDERIAAEEARYALAAARRETAPLARSNAPVSIWK